MTARFSSIQRNTRGRRPRLQIESHFELHSIYSVALTLAMSSARVVQLFSTSLLFCGGSIVPTLDPQFEPMTVGMVLDRSFRLYTQNFPLMLGITAILNVPALALAAVPLLAQRTS